MSPRLQYIFSAPAMIRCQVEGQERKDRSIRDKYVSIIKNVNNHLNKFFTKNRAFPMDIAMLYNAYTEKRTGREIIEDDKLNFSSIYADSGGLQIVTAGKKIEDSLKFQIYEDQSVADFAMCFDEIPTVTATAVVNSGSNRSQVDNKKFEYERLEECARKTGRNIREQIETFIKLKSNTKVLFIVQGNCSKTMVEWFDYAQSELDAHHFDYIAGLALADTCMGNAGKQSIDMIIAYHLIRKKHGVEKVKNHMHLLGVGSILRLEPFLRLMESGFLPKELKVSFDSTSFSMSYFMGKFKDKNGASVNSKNQQEITKYFSEVYDFYEFAFFGHIEKEEYVEYFASHSNAVSKTLNDIDEDRRYIAKANIYMICAYNLIWFMKEIEEIMNYAPEKESIYRNVIYQLHPMNRSKSEFGDFDDIKIKSVETYEDLMEWYAKYQHLLTSRNIKKAETILDSHFEEVSDIIREAIKFHPDVKVGPQPKTKSKTPSLYECGALND